MTDVAPEDDVEFCIWNGLSDRLPGLPAADPVSWAGAFQGQMLAFGRSPDLASRFDRFEAYPGCAAVMMVKDEADIIGANLAWLYHVGVRHFAIIDNDSRDDTPGIVRRFAAAHGDVALLLEHDPIVAHFQAEKTTRMCRIALEEWPDVVWHMPVDADEFLVTRTGLRSLDFVPDEIDALSVPKVIHFRARPASEAGGDGLAAMCLRSTPFSVPPKIILRASAEFSVGKGNHYANGSGGRRVRYDGGLHYGLFHREFQTRSFAQFLSKVRNGGAAILAAHALGRDVGGAHWLAWHRVLTEGGETALRDVYGEVAFREPSADYLMDRFDPAAKNNPGA